jgi:diketogulonate reductase-like aldo/keto reductase
MPMIDTAEMYSNGSAEVLVSGAIAGRRREVLLLDQLLPHHATRVGPVRVYAARLDRLGVDHTNLHLLRWRNRVPLVETIEGFDELELDDTTGHWSVSNFDAADVIELTRALRGDAVQTNQITYLTRRGPEYALPPWLSQLGIPTMADSPIEQGRLLGCPALQPTAIPGAQPPSHVRQNATAGDIDPTRNDLHTVGRVAASDPATSVQSSATAPSVQVSQLWSWLSAAEFRSSGSC